METNVEISDLTISWFLNDSLLYTNESFISITYTSSNEADEGGDYRCQVSSSMLSLTIESQKSLVILAPVIVVKPSPIETIINHVIQFSCSATGYPLPAIEWRRVSVENNFTTLQDLNNVTVDFPDIVANESSINGEMTEVSSLLTIQSVNYDDFGYYLCIATLSLDVLLDDFNATQMDCSSISSTATLTGK